MRRIAFSTLVLYFIPALAFCQDKGKSGRADIPGTFLVEIGINLPQGASSNFSTGLWGSRTANVYYQYDVGMSILTKKLTFVPGIGLGMDRYKFRNNFVMDYGGATNDLVTAESDVDVKKSQLVTNYIDVPLGLRYTSNPHDPSRSFKIEAGIRGGFLISSFTKIKYEEDSETIKRKTRRDWNLNKYRYGLYAKTGVGNFNVMGYYNLSTLFKSGQAPDGNDINTVTVGISIGGF